MVPAVRSAEDPEELPLVTLDAMVVTATRYEIPIMQSPVAISLISREMIERRPAQSMADLLRDLPGVSVGDNTVPGMQRLRIRGEEARRTLVLIDGQEVSDHSTFGPLFLIDPAFVQRIEVVRGPHSTLYGSRASGGVVNVITKRAGLESLGGSVGTTYSGATNGFRANADLYGREGEFDWFVGASRSLDHDLRTPSGHLPDTETSSSGVTGRMGWTHGPHQLALLYDLHRLKSEASTPDRLVDGFRISSFQMNLPQRDRDKVGLVYDGFDLLPSLDRLHIGMFAQSIDRRITQAIAGNLLPPTVPPTLYDYFNDDFDTTDSYGLNAQTDWSVGERHELVTGLSWLRDDLDKTIHRTGTHQQGAGVVPVELISDVKAAISTSAVFLQDTWRIAPDWHLTGGARQYFVSSSLDESNDPQMPPRDASDSRLVGNLGVLYLPTERTSFRATWSEGYVYPTLLQLHTGSLFGQGNLTRPNPTLQPETSSSWEVGMRYQDNRWSVDFAVFTSEANGYIESVRASSLPELGWAPTENTYANLDKARTRGAELAVSTRFGDSGWDAYGTATYLRREIEFQTFTTTDTGKPQWTGRVGARYEGRLSPTLSWNMDAYAVGGGRSVRQTSRSVEAVDGWYTVNLAGGVRFGGERRFWVGAEVLNIFDKEYRPATDELVRPGRHVNLSVRMDF